MAQGVAADVVYVLKAGHASARLHTGNELMSMLRPWIKEYRYHVFREVIFCESAANNLGRVCKSRP
jgi:hypothetical protein